VTANYDAGILTVTLVKKAEAKPKQVKIGIGTGPVEAAKPKQVEAPTAA
jgi:HSP20 family protein